MSPEKKTRPITNDYLSERQNFLDQTPFSDYIEQILREVNKPIETIEDFTKALQVIRLAVWKNDPDKKVINYGLRRNYIRKISSIFPSAEVVDRLAMDIHSKIEQTPYLSDYINDFWVRETQDDIRGITTRVYNHYGRRCNSTSGNLTAIQRHIDRFPTYLSYAQEKSATAQSVKMNGILEDLNPLGFATKLPKMPGETKPSRNLFRLIDSEVLK